MLNLNKNKRIKGIAVVLALVTVLALCLTGCKDQQARDDAAAAKKAADYFVNSKWEHEYHLL